MLASLNLKGYLTDRAADLTDKLMDASTNAICACDEAVWRYVGAMPESSHGYTRLAHKGLVATSKAVGSALLPAIPVASPAAMEKSATAAAFAELQSTLSVTGEDAASAAAVTLAATARRPTRSERLVTSAAVQTALGADAALRALSATRVGAALGLPPVARGDDLETWSELYHNLSTVPTPEDEGECAAGPSTAHAQQATKEGVVSRLTAAARFPATLGEAVSAAVALAVSVMPPAVAQLQRDADAAADSAIALTIDAVDVVLARAPRRVAAYVSGACAATADDSAADWAELHGALAN